jgi:signal transduction histidine kinase
LDQQYLKGMERLVAAIQDLSRARTLEQVQEVVRSAARDVTGADGATFVLRDGEQCFYADEEAIAPLWKGQRFPLSACISGWAMLNAAPAVIEDIYADARIPADAYRPTFVKSLAMVPVRSTNPIAAIGNYWATRRMPTEAEVRLLQALADSTSVALENVGLYAALERRVLERTEALEATKRAEAELRRELEERARAEQALRRTEHQLRQVQKMDAIGQLAGSVAHDFNNIVTVILSYSAIAATSLEPNDPLRADLDEIRKAGERASSLTTRLLAFSRQQVFDAKPLDLHEVARGMEGMLRRLLPANVELDLASRAPLHRVLADESQIEQVLLNLIVNARDAMPDGGRILITTENVRLEADPSSALYGVQDGDYVLLAVTDTGVGMGKDTQARIFEPFFTTKEKGRGTGLGLSTVYGIVKQSNGHVSVQSEPGAGTTFKVYLPRQALEATTARPSALPITASRPASTPAPPGFV